MPRLRLSLVLALHQDLIRRFGGSPALLDPGRLLAALERPWATFGSQDLFPTPWEKAAAYLAGVAKGHPFVDGNKRVAFVLADGWDVAQVAEVFREHLQSLP